MNKGETESVVIGLFHTVLTIVENCNTEGSVLVGKICPLMNAVLEVGEGGGVSALFCTKSKVEYRFFVAYGEGEACGEKRSSFMPINVVFNVNTVAACDKGDGLLIFASVFFLSNENRYNGRSLVNYLDRGESLNVGKGKLGSSPFSPAPNPSQHQSLFQ